MIQINFNRPPYFALKKEYGNIDFARSNIEIGYTGEMKCKKVESIDWNTVEYSLGNEYYDNFAQAIGSYYEIATSASELITEMADDGSLYPSGRIAGGAFRRESWGWNPGHITPNDSYDIYFFTLENVEIVRKA